MGHDGTMKHWVLSLSFWVCPFFIHNRLFQQKFRIFFCILFFWRPGSPHWSRQGNAFCVKYAMRRQYPLHYSIKVLHLTGVPKISCSGISRVDFQLNLVYCFGLKWKSQSYEVLLRKRCHIFFCEECFTTNKILIACFCFFLEKILTNFQK